MQPVDGPKIDNPAIFQMQPETSKPGNLPFCDA